MASKFITQFAKDTVVRMKDSVPTILYYARKELMPPKPTELGEVKRGFGKLISSYRSKGYKQLTVSEAWCNTLVAVEVATWFFIGEIIGRKSLVGYNIKY